MEGGGSRRGRFRFILGLFALGLWCMHVNWVESLNCPRRILPSQVNEIFSARQYGFTLKSKRSQFLYSYCLLRFEVTPFLGIPIIQLWAWVPIAPYGTELVLEYEDLRRSTQRFPLGSFPIIFPAYHSERGLLLEIYCLLTYWMELVPSLIKEEKNASTDVADTNLNECVGTTSRRDLVLLAISWPHAQPSLSHLPYVQEPFIPNMEQLILGTPGLSHQEMDPGQLKSPAEKLCHLQDRRVNLHRAAWGECIVAPKTFNFPYCQGICLAINRELHQSNFQCYKREVPTCSKLFQVCGPTRVRLFSLMVQDDDYKMSVYHLNTSVVEKCGCF